MTDAPFTLPRPDGFEAIPGTLRDVTGLPNAKEGEVILADNGTHCIKAVTEQFFEFTPSDTAVAGQTYLWNVTRAKALVAALPKARICLIEVGAFYGHSCCDSVSMEHIQSGKVNPTVPVIIVPGPGSHDYHTLIDGWHRVVMASEVLGWPYLLAYILTAEEEKLVREQGPDWE